jgi:excisionase family DNA binding protein
MGKSPDQEAIRRLRNQLGTQLDTAAKSVADVLRILTDLLIEIARSRAVEDHEPAESKPVPVPEMLTTAQAADYLGVKVSTLATWRCTRRYQIPFVKVGRRTRYRKADLDKFLQTRTVAHTGETASW